MGILANLGVGVLILAVAVLILAIGIKLIKESSKKEDK